MDHARFVSGSAGKGTTCVPRSDSNDYESGGLSLEEGAHCSDFKRPGLLRETWSNSLNPLKSWSGRSVLFNRRVWSVRREDEAGKNAYSSRQAAGRSTVA